MCLLHKLRNLTKSSVAKKGCRSHPWFGIQTSNSERTWKPNSFSLGLSHSLSLFTRNQTRGFVLARQELEKINLLKNVWAVARDDSLIICFFLFLSLMGTASGLSLFFKGNSIGTLPSKLLPKVGVPSAHRSSDFAHPLRCGGSFQTLHCKKQLPYLSDDSHVHMTSSLQHTDFFNF